MLTLVLNSYLLFQNVYTTYKALKPPKPSRKAKHGVDPLSKAKAARKRELKGMLACWIVWSCWSTAEAIADRTISVLTPFYSEIKMFLILFLIAGRSAMAEPILLHVIRPLIKPYYVPLDACVDIFVSAADLAVLLFSSPLVWIRLVTRHAWNFLQKTFSRGSASLPRPGNHAVSASDADESLNEPNTPSESADATKAKEQEPDPLQRFVPKTRGTLNQSDSEEEEVVYKNPLRDDPPPYGVPVDVPVSRGRDYPPVFSSPRGTSRVRREPSPGSRPFVGRRMSVIDRQPYDISMATSASYRPDSEAETSFAFSPNNSQDILNGAGDLAPDPNIPAFALASPAPPPVSVPAAPAVPSYLQPRTRASRINLRPAQQPVDNYADRPNPRASEFLQGERGMTFADKPKEAKAIIPDASASYVSPPPSGYGVASPQPVPASPPQVPFGNPYVRGRPGPPGPPTRPYVPAEDGYESPRGNSNDLIQNWRQRSAIPVDVKPKRQQGAAGYSYQAATPSYVAPTPSVVSPSIAPSFPVPSVAPSFPVPSIAPSLTPSQSISNVFARPQPGYRPPSAADNRPPTTGPARPASTTPSHPPTTTTGMGLGAPRRQRSTRELRAQAWEPKEDNTAAEAERLAEEERRALEQKEAERQSALDRQRRKVSDGQYQRPVKSKKLTGDAPPTRPRSKAKSKPRGRVRERALRGVEVERKVAAEKDKNVTKEGREDEAEVEVHNDTGEEGDGEESPRKRRRVGDGESVAVVGPSRKPAPARTGVTGSSVTLPAKRPIGEVTSDARPRPLRVAPKPPLGRARPLTCKRERSSRQAAQPSTSRLTKSTRPPVSRLPQANGSKSLASHAFPSGSRNITKS